MKKGILNNINRMIDRLLHPSKMKSTNHHSLFTINQKGQTSLIMILVLAMAFIFYAISLNWSRMANLKTTTWMTATGAASQVASMFASYGERVMWENLLLKWGDDIDYNGGNLEHCEHTWLFIKILVMVIVIVIMVIAQQYWVMILIVAVMMAAALVIDYAVVRPMMFNMWNKLQQNMQTIDQFRESGITSGIQALSTDGIYLPDRWDLDANGLWGFTGGQPDDHVGRFAFYYNERLKFIKPPDYSAYEAFRQSLKTLITNSYSSSNDSASGLGFNPLCTGTNDSAPLCDPQCTGISNRPSGGSQPNVGFGWRYGLNRNQVYYVPYQCTRPCSGAACPNLQGNPYYLLYDTSIELPAPNPFIPDPGNMNNLQNSFRFRLGHDDEIGKDNAGYDSSRATGTVFPMLVRMENIHSGKDFGTLSGLSDAAKALNLSSSTDAASEMANYKGDLGMCARNADSRSGFFWKKGADRYCSGPITSSAYKKEAEALRKMEVVVNPTPRHWPYYQCEYMYDSNGSPVACQTGNTGSLWPQDRLDDFVYELSNMIQFYNYINGMSAQAMVEGQGQWYPQAASIIAPQCNMDACKSIRESCKAICATADAACQTKCDNGCPGAVYPEQNQRNCTAPSSLNEYVACQTVGAYAANPQVCSPHQQGNMLKWSYDLRNWSELLGSWLNQSFSSGSDLCSGSLGEIVQCLSNKSRYTYELQSCKNVFPATTLDDKGKIVYPDMPPACITVIRLGQKEPNDFFTELSGVPDAPVNDTTAYQTTDKTYPIIQTWVNDNTILKSAVSNRYYYLNDLYNYASGALNLFLEGYINFAGFLSGGGPAETLMNVQLSNTISLRRLPGFAIYGWKDDKISTLDQSKSVGKWHLSRMEVLQPSVLPWIEADQEFEMSWFGPEVYSCYRFRDGAGSVWTRATKWDEDTVGGLAKFANKANIWRFRYSNPHPPNYNPIADSISPEDIRHARLIAEEALDNPRAAIEKYCVGRLSDGSLDPKWPAYGKGIGLTWDTKKTLLTDYSPLNPSIKDVSDEAKAYQEAFMINIDPRFKIPPDQDFIGGCRPPRQPAGKEECTYNNGCSGFDWTACCNAAYSNGGSYYGRSSYWGAYGSTYCQRTNKARCQQNIKNQELRCVKAEMKDCFYTVNALLNQGVKSTSGARFWVPPLGYNGINEYHEQIHFHSSQEADAEFRKNNNESNTIVDTDLYR